jgi:hypothetical protein
VISTGQKVTGWRGSLVSNVMLGYKKVPSCQNVSKETWLSQ